MNDGQCVCRRGTTGEPGECVVCPEDSVINNKGICVCRRGTTGEPGQCVPGLSLPQIQLN